MVKINKEQRRYVIDNGHGYSCLGFDVCEKQSTLLQMWLNDFTNIARKGTKKAYNQYQKLLNQARDVCHKENRTCDIELREQLLGLEGKRVEVTEHSGEKRRFYVGKSTGWMPSHLEIKQINSSGGTPVYSEQDDFKHVKVIR